MPETWLRALVVCGLLGGLAAAPGARAAGNAGEPGRVSQRLENGLEILVLPEPERDVAAVFVTYLVGSRDEEAGTRGYAHLFEHLMFTGTAAVPDWPKAMAELGGRSRSMTTTDWTAFQSEVPRTAVRRVLELEADRMRGLSLEAAGIAQATAAIRIEEAARSAEPYTIAAIADRLRPLAFPEHPYARAPVADTLDATAPDRCRAFYAQHYGPDRALLVVAGGVDPDSAIAQASALFGGVASTGTVRAPLPPLPPPSVRSRVEPSADGETIIAIGYRVPGLGKPDFSLSRLVHAFLAGGAAPILRDAVRDGGPPAVLANAALDEATGLLTVAVHLGPGTDPRPARERLVAAVPLLVETIDAQALTHSRDRLRLTDASLASTVSGRAAAAARNYLARRERAAGDASAGVDLIELNPADCARFANTYLGPDAAVSLLIAPPASAGATETR